MILAGDTELTTGEQVEKALYAIWKKTPKKLRKKKGMKFVMSWELWDLYDEYLSAKDSKYSENTDENRHRFKGKQSRLSTVCLNTASSLVISLQNKILACGWP